MFWLVLNKMEQRKELIGFYLFMRMETILSNFMRNWQSFTASLALQIVMWRYRDAKEPLIPEQEKTNYFLMIAPVLTKPGHCVPSRRAKCPCFHPHSLQSRLEVFFLSFSPGMKQKLAGRRFLMATWSVSICRFRAHAFSLHHSTRRHVRRSWESWNCVARRE